MSETILRKTEEQQVFGHPKGLFYLFFAELWERFSFYGMRALLMLYMVQEIFKALTERDVAAAAVYASYGSLVYASTVIGGRVSDKILGMRNSIFLGGILMALGHFVLAIENDIAFFLALAFIIVGNGFFKPNISTFVGALYEDGDRRKDSGFTIFYMGINAGAFLGILLCGYIGENISWHYGFGLAGIFMFFGMLQFYFSQKIFGKIGLTPIKTGDIDDVIEDSLEQIGEDVEDLVEGVENSKVVRDRMIVIGVFSLFVVFFWWAFEQAGGSMTVFAADYTDRSLEGGAAASFKIINTIITIVPMLVITWVLFLLFKQTFSKYSLANTILGFSFVIIWGIVLWMLNREFQSDKTEVPASWFSVLNSLFIILFAPLFSKIWQSKFNPSGPVKFAIGLFLVGLGFAALAYGATGIPDGAKTASVSLMFLVVAYFLHTMGELCVSPVGLSYVSKLAPIKYVSLMFGIWFTANFFANLLGGFTGSFIDPISEEYGMSAFFLLFTLIPIGAGIIMIILNKTLLRMMHGIK